MRYININASDYIEVTCELADYTMQKSLGNKDYVDNHIIEEEDHIKYTKKGQDLFDAILADIEEILRDARIRHEDDFESTDTVDYESDCYAERSSV